MANSLKWRSAEQFFNDGNALFQEKRYDEAVTELLKAEKAFRSLDARGHPWGHPLNNGVSGLANALVLLGRCYQELGHFEQAITCYETSCINKKFELRSSFRAFQQDMQRHLAFCYEHQLAGADNKALQTVLGQDIDIDASFLFPFSLKNNALTTARLFELDPERYSRFSEFYLRAKSQDANLRRKAGKDLEETRMKRATFSIWTIFGLLWIIYSMIMIKALLLN
jgi:tetratricopeptide (TPR) repeat protein